MVAYDVRQECEKRTGEYRENGAGEDCDYNTDHSNPTSRLLLQVLAAVAQFERELIRERTLAGVRAARESGKILGRPKRVFRRDEVLRLRDEQGLSWRTIARELKIPVMTAVDSYRGCTEIAPAENVVRMRGPKRKKSAA